MRRVALKGLAWRRSAASSRRSRSSSASRWSAARSSLTDTMKKASTRTSASSYAGTTAIVSGALAYRDDNSWQKTPSISPQVARRAVRHTPGVAAAAGEIFDLNSKRGEARSTSKGKVITGNGRRTSASASTRAPGAALQPAAR